MIIVRWILRRDMRSKWILKWICWVWDRGAAQYIFGIGTGQDPNAHVQASTYSAAEKSDRRMPRILQGKMKRHSEFFPSSHLVGADISSINSFRWGVFEPTNPSCLSAYTSLTNTHCFESFSLRWYRESCQDPHRTKIDKTHAGCSSNPVVGLAWVGRLEVCLVA